jgi:hypothetical protein
MSEFVTREQGCKLVQAQLGIPLKLSFVEKAACKGIGPEVAAHYGKRVLYRPDDFLAWAESLVEKVEPAAA